MQLITTLGFVYGPAMIANIAPVIATKLNVLSRLNRPIDFGIRMGGMPVLGDNKTVRGFVVGICGAVLLGCIVSLLTQTTPYQTIFSGMIYGAVTGCGALLGDSVKSFFKRRVGIQSGSLWVPFDQIDFVIGATLAALFFISISFYFFLFAISTIGVLSYCVSRIGFALHIKKNL